MGTALARRNQRHNEHSRGAGQRNYRWYPASNAHYKYLAYIPPSGLRLATSSPGFLQNLDTLLTQHD
jgi:hypothetical protein